MKTYNIEYYGVINDAFNGTMEVCAKLNPTGRWKLESTNGSEYIMYIEHKSFLSREWVREDTIRVTEIDTIIFECNGGN